MTRSKKAWTTSADITARGRRLWRDGTLPRRYLSDEGFEPISLPITGPTADEIGDDTTRVRAWIDELQQASTTSRGRQKYALEYRQVGGRYIGRNQIPARAVVAAWDEAWTLLGVHNDVTVLTSSVAESRHERIREWIVSKPLTALQSAGQWPQVEAAYEWLERNRHSRRYLREIDVPGVDTKFVESHRAVLAELLGVPAAASKFTAALGLAAKPRSVRMRFNPGFMGMPGAVTEASLRVDELASMRVCPDTAVIVENEITYLTMPVPHNGVVIFGGGYTAAHAHALSWLRDAATYYWGDIDTHGFAIVHRLRSSVPHARTFLMDAETFHAHRQRWGTEPKQSKAALDLLQSDEASLFNDLVTGRFGEQLRLEQERIDWAWAQARFPWRP